MTVDQKQKVNEVESQVSGLINSIVEIDGKIAGVLDKLDERLVSVTLPSEHGSNRSNVEEAPVLVPLAEQLQNHYYHLQSMHIFLTNLIERIEV